MVSAVELLASDSERCDVGGQRLDLAGRVRRCRHRQAFWAVARALATIALGASTVPAIDSERSTSAASDLTWRAGVRGGGDQRALRSRARRR